MTMMMTTPMSGPAECDETLVGGCVRNLSDAKRKARKEAGIGGGTTEMTAVVGVKDRTSNEVHAKVVYSTDKPTLQGFIQDNVAKGTTVYTDEAAAYKGMSDFIHEFVKHSAAEYVRKMAHTNGIESFWAVLKRAHKGVYHKFSVKHLQRSVTDFAGRHGVRNVDTIRQMETIFLGMIGKRLTIRHSSRTMTSKAAEDHDTRRDESWTSISRTQLPPGLRQTDGP